MMSTLKNFVLQFVLAAMLLAIAANPAAAITQIFETRLTGSDNDAEEDSLGAVNLTDSVLDLGGLYRKTGLRFANVTIVKNAPITRAYVEFTAAAMDSSNTTFTVEAEAQDNPAAFTTGLFNISSRHFYSQTVDWPATYAWSTVGQAHQTADVTALVQKLVNRGGWASGNAMVFVVSNGEDLFRKASSWDQDPNKAAKLHIEYAVNVVDVRVNQSMDDCTQVYYNPTSANVDNTGRMYFGSNYYYPVLRFRDVNIPQGAVINYACLKFVAQADSPTSSGYTRIYGEKRLSPPTFATGTGVNSPYYRKVQATPPKTASYTQWAAHPAWVTGQEYTSYDIKNVVQEIVGQTGWDGSDKSMAFHLSPIGGGMTARYAWTYDGDPAKAPLLHIEYGQSPAGVGTDPPVITLSATELGRSAFEGATADPQRFFVMNSGATALNYTAAVVYNKGTGWLALTPAAGSVSLGPGEEQNYTIGFNTTGLKAGTYDAVIRFTDAAASNSPQELRVSLTIIPQGKIQCGDIPLYTQNIASPAVMILLDLSGSMLWEIDIIPENYDFTNTTTPDVKSVVQEIVNRDGWASGNALTFILENVSGTGRRYARSFDGYSPSSALFHLEYNDGTGLKTIERRVNKSTDDGEAISAIPFSASSQYHRMCDAGNGYGTVYRFENLTLPKGATIASAWMRFVPYRSDSDPLTVKISAHASDNSPTFVDAAAPQLFASSRPRTAASVNWVVPEWTGVTIESKIDIAKTVISELVKDTGISWGFGSWANDLSPYVSTNDYTQLHVGCNAHTAEHQAKLQAAVSGLSTYSSTPFSPSLIAGRKYFAREKADNDGILFEEASCQPKFLIEVTDGMGNVDSTKENVIERTNLLLDQGVTPIGIGFGLAENETEQLYAYAETANTRGKASAGDTLYPMHLEAGGKGIPYMTKNKDELMNAFRTIMNSVKGAVFYGSAPAATTSTDQGDVVILSSFNAGNWTGEVEAISKNSNGSWNASVWKASQNFPTTRNVWTVNASNTLVSYTGDTLSGDNYLCKNLGDIIHSTPAVVGAPPFFYTFDGYSAFKRAHSVTSPRERMICVGSNDGLLHAFSLEEGVEKWAFLPKSLQAKLNQAASGASYDPCSTSYCHQSLLDGSPQVADVHARFGAVNKQWRTMLVVGQRGGGTAYTALDITSGKGFGDATSPARFLWEFTDSDLGESWADVVIERVRDTAGANERAWGAYFGSGYSENDNTQYLKEAYLFGLEADTGTGLWSDGAGTISKIKLTPEAGNLNFNALSGAAPGPGVVVSGQTSGAYGTAVVSISNGANGQIVMSNVFKSSFANGERIVWSGGSATVTGTFNASTASQKNNALGGPATGSFGTVSHADDCIYVGDLYGTMFRVDNIGKGQTPSVSRLFQFNPYPSGPDERPVRSRPSIAYNDSSDGLWVYYGTGRYETAADKVNSAQQYFLGLRDGVVPRATPYALADLTALEARFVTATIGGTTRLLRTISGSNSTNSPWALKLYAGQAGWGGPAITGGSERVFTKPLVVGGIVFFTTFIPDADMCTGSGDTYVFALDYKTGLPPTRPVFDLNGDKKFTDADKIDVNGQKVVPIGIYVGRGQGSAPVLFKDTLFITTSTPQFQLSGTVGSGNVTGLNALLVNIPQKRIHLESWKHE
jgi:hypothetical protein